MFVAKLRFYELATKLLNANQMLRQSWTIQEVHKKGTNVQKSRVSKETVVLFQTGEWDSKIAGSGLTIHHNGNST